jgi:hypothetical protein
LKRCDMRNLDVDSEQRTCSFFRFKIISEYDMIDGVQQESQQSKFST